MSIHQFLQVVYSRQPYGHQSGYCELEVWQRSSATDASDAQEGAELRRSPTPTFDSEVRESRCTSSELGDAFLPALSNIARLC